MDINVDVKKYNPHYSFLINRVSSINNVKNNSVLFINKKNAKQLYQLLNCRDCLIFIEKSIEINPHLKEYHCFILCDNPRLEFCRFFEENKIASLPKPEKYCQVNSSLVSCSAQIGENVTIMPFSVINGEVIIGDNVYIGCGTKILSPAIVGNNVTIRENVIIGTDSLAFEKDEKGRPIKFPQFGGVRIGNNVDIGANSIIGRGSIDDTVIGDNVKIDYNVYIAHNCIIGENSILVGGTKVAGSTKIGKNVYLSNASIINKVSIGDNSFIGWGSAVLHNVPSNRRMFGYPAERIDI